MSAERTAAEGRRTLASYVGDLTLIRDWFDSGRVIEVQPRTILYAQVGSSGVYMLSDRDRRLTLWMRHYDEHHCPHGTAHCDEAMRLWEQIDERDRPVAIG